MFIFWQELFFREEDSRLPFMQAALERARRTNEAEPFSRVQGFLFLDIGVSPDANKTIVAKSGSLRQQLFDRDSSSCKTVDYTRRLLQEYMTRVKEWSQRHDRLVSFPPQHTHQRWPSPTLRDTCVYEECLLPSQCFHLNARIRLSLCECSCVSTGDPELSVGRVIKMGYRVVDRPLVRRTNSRSSWLRTSSTCLGSH